MINCYNSEYKGNVLKCAVTGEKCDPRICKGCDRLSTVNYYTKPKAINELLDYCEKNCKKYYQCDRNAELLNELKKFEEQERKPEISPKVLNIATETEVLDAYHLALNKGEISRGLYINGHYIGVDRQRVKDFIYLV